MGAIPELLSSDHKQWITDGIETVHLASRMEQFLQLHLEYDPAALRSHAEQYAIEKSASQLLSICDGNFKVPQDAIHSIPVSHS